ncbi:MAG: aspartate aminotransferase family protein [Kiloniellales bacterium]|nr:aspartate aminotransferase family protein [Kiloniellales bacterium]
MTDHLETAFSFSNRHKDLMARDAEHVLGWRYEPRVVFERGEGVKLFDVDGNEYYDLSSGMMCLVLGHAHPELVETIKDMAGRFVHQSSWYTNPWAIELAELIASTLPDGLDVINFAVTGSEANEIAMRMALGATGGFDICSVVRGLHGGSLAAEAVTSVGGARKRGLGPLSMPARSNSIVPAFYYRAPVRDADEWDRISLQMTDDLIEFTTSQEVAALMLEPIAVPGGMIVPSKNWMRGIKEIADKWEALLIFDECQLAPSRTGKMWGFQRYDVTPDIVTFGKGMSAGFAICGTATTREVAEASSGKKGLPWAGTYPQDPLSCAVALKQLEIVLRDDITGRAAKMGDLLESKLAALAARYECIGDVRGAGLYRMLDIVSDPESRQADPALAELIRREAMAEGLVMIAVKNYMRVCPPLIITEAEIDDVVGRLDRAITKAMSKRTDEIDFSSSGSLAANEKFRQSA